jgi:hypothetical protein
VIIILWISKLEMRLFFVATLEHRQPENNIGLFILPSCPDLLGRNKNITWIKSVKILSSDFLWFGSNWQWSKMVLFYHHIPSRNTIKDQTFLYWSKIAEILAQAYARQLLQFYGEYYLCVFSKYVKLLSTYSPYMFNYFRHIRKWVLVKYYSWLTLHMLLRN